MTRLAARVESNLQAVAPENGGQAWDDAGYWLVIAMLLPVAFWFRRGWTVHHG